MQSSRTTNRHRQIGRKVLLADRLARVSKPQQSSSPLKKFTTLLTSNPKRVRMVSAGLVLLFVVAGIGGTFISGSIASARDAEQQKQYKEQKQKSAAADACRRQKVEQNPDLVGKVTYDELYNYGECEQ